MHIMEPDHCQVHSPLLVPVLNQIKPEILTVLGWYTVSIGSRVPLFQGNLISPNLKGQAVQVCSYIGNGVNGEWVLRECDACSRVSVKEVEGEGGTLVV
jgi:hypothetical protein